MEESAVSRSTIIFRREVTGQFHSKLLLSLDTAKAEAIVVGPVKWKRKVRLESSDSSSSRKGISMKKSSIV